MALPTLEDIESAYRETGIWPTTMGWIKRHVPGHPKCACPITAVLAHRMGWDQIDMEDNICGLSANRASKMLNMIGFTCAPKEVDAFISGVDGHDDYTTGHAEMATPSYDLGQRTRDLLRQLRKEAMMQRNLPLPPP